MNHNDIYKWFELYFELYVKNMDNNEIMVNEEVNVAAWFQNGKNSIRIRQTNGQEFIFTYNSPKDWRFETIQSYINNSRGKSK